jgi:hypothetical protein
VPPQTAITSVEIDNEDAVRLFAAMFADGDGDDARTAATAGAASRVMYLQKIGFPSATKAGRGRRVTHDIEAVLKLATAMQLIDLGVSAARAAVTVSAYWRMLSHTLAQAWSRAGGRAKDGTVRRDKTQTGPALLCFRPAAVSTGDGALVTDTTNAKELDLALREGSHAFRGVLLLNPAALVSSVEKLLTAELRYRDAEVADAMERFAQGR